MLVSFSRDNMGSVHGSPVSARIQKVFADHCKDFSPNHDGCVFYQEMGDEEIQETLDGLVPHRKIKELQEGYAITVRMDSYDYGMMVGLDAHLA